MTDIGIIGFWIRIFKGVSSVRKFVYSVLFE